MPLKTTEKFLSDALRGHVCVRIAACACPSLQSQSDPCTEAGSRSTRLGVERKELCWVATQHHAETIDAYKRALYQR